ncbi:MAG: 16S rRNA (uracil(1498)-N(3))-methyltransferase [Eubacteriales bacterium]|nr:16S rRNA (uracil(1498)-N(3))-methyltransferase [Eubacteriales bacterium]
MVHIFADLSAMQGDLLSIGGKDYNHIKNVLRMHPGEELAVRGEGGDDGNEYRFEIVSFSDTQVNCRLLSVQHTDVELPVSVILFQGLPKSDKMDFIVQKAVEMGAAQIVPVEMRRSVVKLAGDKRKKRVARWQSIAEAAAKQSRRAFVPQVREILSMEEALACAAAEADVLLVPYEGMAAAAEQREQSLVSRTGASSGAAAGHLGTRAILESIRPGRTIAVMIGPEGGFEDAEIEAALEKGAQTVSLGRRILRTETAALAFLSFLIYRFEL